MIAGETWAHSDLVRRRFGAWLVVAAHRNPVGGFDPIRFVCRCACGHVSAYMAKRALLDGLSRSCGCVDRDFANRIAHERNREADELEYQASEDVRAVTRTTGVAPVRLIRSA